ncbi:MAG TPA: hypothetical protein VKX49_23760 [Bryobacteraceae bacterium]|jgi:hypothetical protein|nr:hypothetical protein [Bryobacteraceae bacterium]
MTTLTADDKKRLGRQLDQVRELVLDRGWWTLGDIQRGLIHRHGGHFPEASISARLRDLRSLGYTVERKNLGAGLFAYRVTKPERVAEQEEMFA